MNGANIGTFDLNSPPDTESAGLGDDRIRSTKTTLQQVLDDEHAFPSGGGANVGYHRFGSARPYYGTQSAVSSSGTDGRLMLTSDTSRLFGVGSGGTVLLGGPTAMLGGEYPGTVPQRHYWAEEWGAGTTGSTGSVTITFPRSGFSGLPNVQVTLATPVTGIDASLQIHTVDGASVIVSAIGSGSFLSDQNFFWRSLGSRVL